MEKAASMSDALTSVRPSVVTLAKFFLGQISQVPRLMIHAPATDRINKLQVLCMAVASWAGELKQEVAEDRWTRSELLKQANGAQAERDLARQRYELSVSSHPTLAKLMKAMDTWVQSAKTDAMHARENASKIMEEWRTSQNMWQASLDNVQGLVDKQIKDLKALRTKYHLLTTPEEPTARDLVECLVLQNGITEIQADQAEKKVHKRDEGLRKAQDELRQAKDELAKAQAEWETHVRALEHELYKVRSDVIQRDEEAAQWRRNDGMIAEFVRQVTDLREQLLAKDAKIKGLQWTLREQPEEVQRPTLQQQLEMARHEFQEVEQRFALIESSDLCSDATPTFSPVLIETLCKNLDAEFDLMKQLQLVQLATTGATTLATREKTPEATTPASSENHPAEFQTPEGQATAMEIDTSTSTLVERHQLDRLRADLVLSQQELEATRQEKERLEGWVWKLSAQLGQVQPQLEKSRQEKEAADKQLWEVATQLECAQRELKKVRTQADLKAAFADLDAVSLQLDEEHERNDKLQAQVQALVKEI
ncbi:hypothetical protein R1flu_012244 [Riccia fluitans]|uniref:Uncharacterized protein n=1 Tax=Riccia fluitans TaxID=41844 RepID=A0ABD1ZE68_9MARC